MKKEIIEKFNKGFTSGEELKKELEESWEFSKKVFIGFLLVVLGVLLVICYNMGVL